MVGVVLNITDVNPSLQISEQRIQSLDIILLNILSRQSLGSGEAASLAGKLGVCYLCVLWPFWARQAETYLEETR